MATAVVEERQLLKTLRWWDGFTIALCNPGFLLGSLGFTLGVFGVTGSIILWGISAFIGVLQAFIYSEPAAMFPTQSGGISLYAHEGWRKYTTLVGPIATFGYWIGWSVVLSIFGKIIGDLITARWFPDSTWTVDDGLVQLGAPPLHRHRRDRARVALQRLRHQPFVWLTYVCAACLMVPLFVFIVLPYLTGDWHASNIHSTLPRPVGRREGGSRLPLHPRLVGVRHRDLCHLRARVQGHEARHGDGAAHRLDLRAARVHAAAAGPRRRDRRAVGRHGRGRLLRAAPSSRSSATRSPACS